MCDHIWENQLVSEKINYPLHAEIVIRARNGNKEKEARLTRRRSIRLASNLDDGIFARRKR